jgi:hypothetical protein
MRGGDTGDTGEICDIALDSSTSEVTQRLKLSPGRLWEIQATGFNTKGHTLGSCGLSLFVPDEPPGQTGASGSVSMDAHDQCTAVGSCVRLPDGRSGVVTGRMVADNGWNVQIHGGVLASFGDGILVPLPTTVAICPGSQVRLSDGRTGVFNRWLPDGNGWVVDMDGGAEETFHEGTLYPTQVAVAPGARVQLPDGRFGSVSNQAPSGDGWLVDVDDGGTEPYPGTALTLLSRHSHNCDNEGDNGAGRSISPHVGPGSRSDEAVGAPVLAQDCLQAVEYDAAMEASSSAALLQGGLRAAEYDEVSPADEAAGFTPLVDKELGMKANKAPWREKFTTAPDWAVRFR